MCSVETPLAQSRLVYRLPPSLPPVKRAGCEPIFGHSNDRYTNMTTYPVVGPDEVEDIDTSVQNLLGEWVR